MRVWDATSGDELLTLKAPDGVTSVALSADGSRAVSGSADFSVVVWDVATQKELKRFSTQRLPFVTINAAGTRVAAADGTQLKVWEVTP